MNRRFSQSNPHQRQPQVEPRIKIDDVSHSMFHAGQQSSAILNEHRRRNVACYEQMRNYEFKRYHFYTQCMPPQLSRPQVPKTVKLTMEVQNSDFASLVGQREAWAANDSISDIMYDTECMIQFADQHVADAHANPMNFNQVVVTGKFPNIDEAHRRIRYLSPITIAISLKNAKAELTNTRRAKSIKCWLTEWCSVGGMLNKFEKIQFDVLQTPFYSRSLERDPFLVIRGSYCCSEEILKASDVACSLLFDSAIKKEFCARMEVPVAHRRWIVGSPDGILMRKISTMSCATIHFPVSTKGLTPTSYFITGSASSCVEAVKMFYEVGPLKLEFDLGNEKLAYPVGLEQEKNRREYNEFDTEHNVMISLRKSPFEGSFRLEKENMRHSISLLSSEENLNNLYAVRHGLMRGNIRDSEKIPPNRRSNRPRFVEYLRVLVTQASEGEKPKQKTSKAKARVAMTSKMTADPSLSSANTTKKRHNVHKGNVFNFKHGGYGDNKHI